MADSPPIARLRAALAAAAPPGVVVSAAPRQLYFTEASAAYAEIDVVRGEAFELVVGVGSLPSEAFVVDVWHRYAPEVWLLDPIEEAVYVALRDGPIAQRSGRQVLRPRALPEVAIAVGALFALLS